MCHRKMYANNWAQLLPMEIPTDCWKTCFSEEKKHIDFVNQKRKHFYILSEYLRTQSELF